MSLAFLFPGQGSQWVGMGRALFEAFPEARRTFDEADAVLGEPLSRLCFEGPEAELRRTRNTQPAMLTVSTAAHRVVAARGVRCDLAAGHSLGEYSALVALSGLRFEDALRLTRRRGVLMQEAAPEGEGGMAAVIGLPADTVRAVCDEVRGDGIGVVEPANFNGGGQVVVGGASGAVAEAGRRLRAAGARRVLPLPVSAPFHTRLMAPAARRLAPELDRTRFADLEAPLWTNVDAAPVTTGAAARDGLRRQVASAVRWEETVAGMRAAGARTFVELGEGRVLSGLARRIARGCGTFAVSDPAGVERLAGALGEAAA